jgi:ketosteroid isomerase-like protein
MLFYVQMRWNYQGRISQDELWQLEEQEGVHGIEGIRAGFVQLYKVVSQHRIIAIVQSDSLEDLDRNSMGWLPMREYLEFEAVWPLREYEGFIEDVRGRFPREGAPRPAPASTREVAQAWFDNLGRGDFDAALKLVHADVFWTNIPPTPDVSDLAPWLGTYQGLPAVIDSFGVWAQYSRMLSASVVGDLIVDGDNAIAIVHEHAQCLANSIEYDLMVATRLRVVDGKIVEWQVYWDPSPLIRAYRNL